MADRNKVVLVLVDGLRYDTATHEMGFLEGALAHGKARRWAMRCALPSLSRSLYHTIHTGLPPQEHGITSNDIVRASAHDNVFSLCRSHGRRTADMLVKKFVPDHLLVHPMGCDHIGHQHGGTREEVRMVQFYHLGGDVAGAESDEVFQLSVAPTILDLMKIAIPDQMTAAPLI